VDEFEEEGQTGQRPGPSSRNPLVVVWRRKSLVLLGAVVGLVLGALVYAQRPPVYQSSAQVLVVKKRSDSLPVAGGDPRSLQFYEDYASTHMVLIRSPLVVQKAVRKRNLASLKSFEGHGDPTGIILAGLSASRDTPKDTTAAPNNIINLSYKGGDSGDAGTVLAAVIDSYRDFLDETYRNVSDNTLSEITNARDLLKRDVAEKQKKYLEFLQTVPRYLSKGTDGLNVHQKRINTYQTEQTALQARLGEIKQRLAKIEQGRKEGKSDAMLLALAAKPLSKKDEGSAGKDVTLEMKLHEHLFPLQLKEKALLQDYGDDHPEVLRVREQIAMTKDYFERLEGVAKKGAPVNDRNSARQLDHQIEALRQDLAVIETVHQSLNDSIEKEIELARGLALYENQDEAFRREIGGTEKVLEQVVTRLQAINVGRDNGGYDARVIAEPGPGGKVSPVAYQLLVGGLLFGLLLGVGVAYLLEITDKSFRSPEEIRRHLRLPIIGHIPYLAQQEVVPVSTSEGTTVEVDGGLVEFHRPRSVEAEAYRAVRTALYFNTHGERHKVIQVTSPNMGDGKSTVITNVAVAIAQSGRKVILLDADLRRPRVHRIFGLTARKGLAQVIAGTAELSDVVQQTVVPNLSVLPCGARPADPSELLTLPRFADLLEELRETYDYVLIDTPPLLAVSDPCAVAPRVDGVVLTIRVSKNGRPAAERACDVLTGLKVHVYGVVVNGVGKEGAMAGYGSVNYQYAYEYSDAYTSSPEDDKVTGEQNG
jgi:capsular exopolysaccharide synthesis family protein